ncbi:undecaprenyldiphospho-muramoylpentapeptide beta-N-acetylglucosaminyltransferase [Acetobacter orleanensis]|uniref:UDP-N-acetylglucosamine--N-acetylmuramyl-(pentapeptide) pyrophosphoryl-undecaprenol N-acetylglucosamine transferase n=1 Tax=Acetobacter orleanensis TaxID=104099 RepID=A0A4Y3TKS3_9PROT|nr:undecaprenyldiphospho-muramoylpentapeptide beta-N-acetylglucosaminyltransferase [Acetobacter orleanensis]KXV63589.1 UDP-diphospho-muramoylpentapeptide beta-N-acetylglucosaminyltransferase [Acetobacter orleanensis]PCD80161.1 undecaprenyldiphospho-muramoylpentapeptide beta-N-acetylglucosaminyltransferase [Acetobacter orleanensis]GAN68181.1 undecaprenyldiphospho-muramoylpentapeptide beta-N- acetylglucosaminyltransferase [Acetobacter orleanensis JCM 7639]GEB82926.1 UDP-N-acetylglucosamine--N-ace
MTQRTIVIAAGGTGGHFFPAEALADALAERGHRLVLMTDARAGARATGVFSRGPQYVLPGAGVAGRGPLRAFKSGLTLLSSAWKARSILRSIQPDAVVGFGGYPSVPPLLGARLLGRKHPALIIHEGNAVLGKANAVLSRFADVIATSFPSVAKLPIGARTAFTGMPVRPAIAALAGEGWTMPDQTINLLVWGGSLGASVFAKVVPAALGKLPEALRARLHVTQQARQDDLEATRKAYADMGITARVEPFLHDVPALLQSAHLVIGRAGGSSVAEITTAGRPSILVPLPIAASDEQTENADAITTAGAGWMIRQPDFTAVALADRLNDLLTAPEELARAAAAAASLARPDAATRLADIVEECLHLSPSPAYPTPPSQTESNA